MTKRFNFIIGTYNSGKRTSAYYLSSLLNKLTFIFYLGRKSQIDDPQVINIVCDGLRDLFSWVEKISKREEPSNFIIDQFRLSEKNGIYYLDDGVTLSDFFKSLPTHHRYFFICDHNFWNNYGYENTKPPIFSLFLSFKSDEHLQNLNQINFFKSTMSRDNIRLYDYTKRKSFYLGTFPSIKREIILNRILE